MPITYLFNAFKKWKNKVKITSFEKDLEYAKQGDVKAQYEVGLCYKYGYGVKINHHQAFKWFKKSAHQGHAKAQYYLSSCFASGKGVKKDPNKAFFWLKEAAEQGYTKAVKLIDKAQQTYSKK